MEPVVVADVFVNGRGIFVLAAAPTDVCSFGLRGVVVFGAALDCEVACGRAELLR